MDYILLDDIAVSTVIGTYEEERRAPRKLLVSLRIAADLSGPGAADTLAGALDYEKIAREIAELGQQSHYFLLEAFAEACARKVLADPLARGVRVRVVKPAILDGVGRVSVEINR